MLSEYPPGFGVVFQFPQGVHPTSGAYCVCMSDLTVFERANAATDFIYKQQSGVQQLRKFINNGIAIECYDIRLCMLT
jgi:hypothetical protein